MSGSAVTTTWVARTEPEPRRSVDLRCFALAALAACALDAAAASGDVPECRVLQEYRQKLTGRPREWRHQLAAYVAAADAREIPLLKLAAQIGLNQLEILAISLASAD